MAGPHIQIVGHGPEQATYYYTNVILVGSHLPVVIRKFRGRTEIVSGGVSHGSAYGLEEGSGARAGNASSILRNDPAIGH